MTNVHREEMRLLNENPKENTWPRDEGFGKGVNVQMNLDRW